MYTAEENAMAEQNELSDIVTSLPRGGYLVKTRNGHIQFGAPPETIKDTMLLPESTPQVFVLPYKLFNWDKGISLAELEFPIYFNFFIKKKKTYIICHEEQAERLLRVLQEAVFGPSELDISQDFHPTLKDAVLPELKAELAYYKNFAFSDILQFYYFVDNEYSLDDIKIKINKKDDFEIFDKNIRIAEVPGQIHYSPKFDIGARLKEPYKPPLFGVTCLGPSHGFDPTENTSGFIVWLNHSGIMIDPPVNSTEWLEDSNVNPKLINCIILTHCHADHDAGTFQKILEEGRITIYTTKTIMHSFLRKYSALSNEPIEYLTRLFNFQPVYIGKPIFINGGKFNMHYSLHSIPTIGFTIHFEDQSMVYSSDHQNGPLVHNDLLAKGIISQARYDELAHFPWDAKLIYHESGIPPLHTSIDFLNSLHKDIQKKTVVYHIAKKDFPEKTSLTLARFGIENTIYLNTKPPKFEKTYQILSILKHLDFFHTFSIEKVQEFIMSVEEEKFKKGAYIIKKGSRGDKFYIIGSGNVSVEYDNSSIKKIYGIYEYFGEVALLTEQERSVDIIAETDVLAYTITKDHFLSFISGTEFEETLKRLLRNRDQETWEILSTGKSFQRLTSYQKTWLESVLHPVEITEATILIQEDKQFDNIYIVRNGNIEASKDGKRIADVGRGEIIGAMHELDRNAGAEYTFTAHGPVSLYEVKRHDYEKFIERNPGLLMKLANEF